ncbi:MAG: glycosyltransferase family 9 protein [Candidatus Obscuribacterales bacterium]|nr:glycosyltransferase family 9 protein [Candidatus Obscuribacterales bacterium]
MKVLIIRLSAMGDIVHGLPAAALLKKRLPGLELSWLVEAAGIPLLEGNPVVDRLIVFPKKKWLQQLPSVSGFFATTAEAQRFVGMLRASKFDAVLDFQGLLKSSLLGFLSGSNLRLGFKGTREGAESLLTHALDVGDYFGSQSHVVDLNIRLADYACRLLQSALPGTAGDTQAENQSYIYDSVEFPLPQADAEAKSFAQSVVSGFGSVEGAPLIAFIPGTTWQSKIWESKNWIELGKLCLERKGASLLLLGGRSEQKSNAEIAAALGARVIDLSGKTDIKQLIALFAMTDIVVGADTGPLHLAAASGNPRVLAVFGSTPPERNGPYGPQCRYISLNLDCQPCFRKTCPLGTLACLKELSPEAVFAQIPFQS